VSDRTFEFRDGPVEGTTYLVARSEAHGPYPYLVAQLQNDELQQLADAAVERSGKKILPEDIQQLKADALAAGMRTVELAAAPDTERIDLQDANMAEIKAWSDYAKGLEAYLETAAKALKGEYSTGAVPVPLNTLTYAATALEGSSDNGDRYAAMQIRQAIAKHPVAAKATAEARPNSYERFKVWLDAHLSSPEHKPVQHRDGKEPWCKECRTNAEGNAPKSRFDRSHVVITDSAGVPVYAIETTPEENPRSHDGDHRQPKELDPEPWHAIAPEGKVIKGPTRFKRLEQAYSNGETRFEPREHYEQDWTAYPVRQRPKLDPMPWRYDLIATIPLDKRARETEQVTGGFSFAPRPQYVQEKGYYG
jgi:hypothetical protein